MSGTPAARVPRRPGGAGRPGSLRVGSVAGAPVYVSWTWLLVPLFTVVAFRADVARAAGVAPGEALAAVLAVGVALLLFLAVVLHEVGHALAARLARLPVHEVVVDMLGGHTTFRSPAGPLASALTALAGPLVNVVLAVVIFALTGSAFPATSLPPGPAALTDYLLGLFVAVNAVLAVFNLLPGLPLDGGRVLEGLVWWLSGSRDAGTTAAAWGGRLLALALLGLMALVLASGAPSLLTLAVLAILAWSLWRGSAVALKTAAVRRRAAAVDLASVTVPLPAHPAGGTVASLATALGQLGLPADAEAALVDPAGRPVAVVSPGTVGQVPVERWAATPLSAVARAVPPVSLVPAGSPASEALAALAEAGGAGLLAVDPAGRVVGRVDVRRLVAAVEGS